MRRLRLQADFEEVLQAIRNFNITDDMIEGLIEFWRLNDHICINKDYHLLSYIGETCIHAGYELRFGDYWHMPYYFEPLFVGVMERASSLQANGYTIELEEGRLDDKSEERFFRIVEA